MRNGFNASVPARMPRTQIGRVLTELVSEPEAPDVEGAEESAATEPAVEIGPTVAGEMTIELPLEASRGAATEAISRPVSARPAVEIEPAVPEPKVEPAAPPADPSRLATDPSRLAAGHERIAALRDRLAAAARHSTAAAEPGKTAAVVREMVEDLRVRLDEAVHERTQLNASLDEARAALTRVGAELERERKARVSADARAEERQRIADDAVAEAEALAAERDQLIGELTEHRTLDDEQAALLMEIEAELAQREAGRATAARDLAELRELLDVRDLELADLQSRLKAEAADRARLETRNRDLEADVARLTKASEALEAIEAMVTRRP
ncbi:MAG: hypothetical protein GEU90_11460 [Gemmatimonas sp.]|nr:hypothetical protein [Gemmatimonas sp.]